MRLEVSGMHQAAGRFVQLWGKYVSGFNSDKHCIYCLKGKQETRLKRQMEDTAFDLDSDSPFFYLFAMGRVPKHDTNVHLAVRHQLGAVASIGSVYGAVFTIRDAFAIRVDRLPDGWRSFPPEFTQCRNFQFGVQQFGYTPPVDPGLPVADHVATEPESSLSLNPRHSLAVSSAVAPRYSALSAWQRRQS